MIRVSVARLALLEVLQLTTGAEVAARCRRSQSRVSEWRSGATEPDDDAKRVLHVTYGIRPSDWQLSAADQLITFRERS